MICNDYNGLPAPGTDPVEHVPNRIERSIASLNRRGAVASWTRLVVLTVAWLVLGSVAAMAQAGDALPEGTVTEIRIEGNQSITTEKIRALLLSKANQPFDQQKVEADLKSLMRTKWFSDVSPFYEESPPKSGKYILIFRVTEMPILRVVELRGRSKISQKEIEENTGLKVGNRADPTRTRLALAQIERLYQEKGYELATVKLLEGGNVGDTKVVIQIFEGPKYQIASIDFKGNTFASNAQLWTKITSRRPIIGSLGGKYHRDMLDEDARKLREYYQSQGFFEVQVTPVTRAGESLGDVHLTFVVSEGVRYKVRDLIFEGNQRIKEEDLREGLQLHSGKPFLDAVRDADRNLLLTRYNELGCIETQILTEPRFTDEPGVVDLVYRIEESEPFTMGELIIRGNTRTKDKVIRREAVMAGLLPGEVLDKNRIETFQKRLGALGYFQTNPEMGKPIDIKIVNKRPHDKPYGDLMMPMLGELGGQARMQGGGGFGLGVEPAADRAPRDDRQVARMQGGDSDVELVPAPEPIHGGSGFGLDAGAPGLTPFGSSNLFSPPPNTMPPIAVPDPGPPGLLGGPGAPVRVESTPPLGSGEPPATFPSVPGLNMTDVGPDRQDPFPNRAFADIVTSLEEAPTGRFMLGVAASSFQGLFGNLTIYEKNFDLFNVPRSFNDIFNGTAFRGGGQEFRLDLQPGTNINRMQVSIRDPYLFDLPIGAGAAGYYFTRFYPDWSERRGGGRFSLGRQFGTATYADVAVRAEDINFHGFRSPAPAQYLAAAGHSTLVSLRPTLRFDNRNSPFLATKGQYAEFSYEQGWGTFTWSKFDAEGRAYFTTGTRPDGTGKRFITTRGHFGIASQSTPVYERFFAGNFGSLRGFQYRTISPKALGVPTGGVLMAVGSLEYQFPWNASDTVQQVFFTDFGTVEGDYRFNKIRVSVGTGIRLLIPQMGPIPLGFDLAFPVMHAEGDAIRYFNFSMSAMY